MWVVSSYSPYNKTGKFFYLRGQQTPHLQMFYVHLMHITMNSLADIHWPNPTYRKTFTVYSVCFFGNTSYLGDHLPLRHLFGPLEIDTVVGNHVNVYEKFFIEVIPFVF